MIAFAGREVFLLAFFSVVLAMLMAFPIQWINKVLPRGLSVLLTLLLMFGTLGALVLFAMPTLSKQVDQLKVQVPIAAEKVEHWIIGAEKSAQALKPGKDEGQREKSSADSPVSSEGVVRSATQLTKKALSAVVSIIGVFSAIILLVILAAFLAYDPEGYREGIRLFVPKAYESQFDEVWRRLTLGLKHWVGGIFIEMVIMGFLTGIGLWIVGVEGAIALGLLTFFATFVPYIGAITSAVPGLLMGLAKDPQHLFYASIVYLGVHIVEGYILSPYVMRYAIQLRPALLLFWQALMGALFGIVGIIVATPLLASLKALIGYFYVELMLGKEAPKI